jgi:hypothetical protein
MSSRNDFRNLSETLLWLDEDDANNTLDAFLGLVLLVLKSQEELLMPCGKTLELGF